MSSEPTIIKGGIAVDDRGTVSFVNEFDFKEVKRSYIVRNFSNDTIRAFHGHLKEAKYVYVISGSAVVNVVKMTSPENPSKSEEVKKFILSEKNPSVLFIPGGYANGFKVLEKGTVIMFFSTATLEESKNDDYRFPYDYWGTKIWEVENR